MVFNIVVLLLNIMILAVIYIVLRRRIDRLTDTDTMSSRLAGDLDLILAEMNQVTDRNVAIIEDKIKELEGIISTAESRIKLLTKTIQKPSAVPKKDSPDTAPQPQKENAEELTYNHLNRMRTMSGMVTPMKVPERAPDTEKSIKERVIELYKNGFDSSVIASSIGVNRGEVELIISLHQQMNNKQD